MLQIIDKIEEQIFLRTEDVGCLLCGTRKSSRNIKCGFGMMAMVAECKKCRLAFQTPRPSPEASRAYMNWRWASGDTYVADRAAQEKRAMTQLRFLKPFFKTPVRLLDFGSGAGSFVRAALNDGWDATGVEQTESAVKRARDFYGVELQRTLGDDPDDSYDVVTMWDVVEHLRQPEEILRLLRSRLNPEGWIFIETGNFENWNRLVQKDRWGLYLFDHHFYFTPYSLQMLLKQVGFENFKLLDGGRVYPPRRLGQFIRRPVLSTYAWSQWAYAKARWPKHGDINVMVVAAQKTKL